MPDRSSTYAHGGTSSSSAWWPTGKIKTRSYSGSPHSAEDWVALTKAGVAGVSWQLDQFWRSRGHPYPFILPHPPSLRNMVTDPSDMEWVFERFNVLKRLLLFKWVGLKLTRWRKALLTSTPTGRALWPLGLYAEMFFNIVLVFYLSRVLEFTRISVRSCSPEIPLWD